jgi:hypothetical protein
VGQFVVAGEKLEVPARPFALQEANGPVLGVEYIEGSANEKNRRRKSPTVLNGGA